MPFRIKWQMNNEPQKWQDGKVYEIVDVCPTGWPVMQKLYIQLR